MVEKPKGGGPCQFRNCSIALQDTRKKTPQLPMRGLLKYDDRLLAADLDELNVNRNIDTCGQVELLQFVHRRSRWLNDVDQTLVRADFKLVHGLFVNVNRTIHSEPFNLSWKWHWARYASA